MPHPTDDLEQFRRSKPFIINHKPAVPSPQPHDWFFKGPIPGAWLQTASGLPGRTLHVGLAIWFMCGLTKKKEVRVTRRVREQFCISPDAFRRGLRKLEEAELVSVVRRSGCMPMVTILDAPTPSSCNHKKNDDATSSHIKTF